MISTTLMKALGSCEEQRDGFHWPPGNCEGHWLLLEGAQGIICN